ncbi:MAG: SDR family NAD(P)-dependent oxidoreductase, partial [Candidatus Binatia bacterium]
HDAESAWLVILEAVCLQRMCLTPRQEVQGCLMAKPPARRVAKQSVLITGATSGIGRATAELLAREGYLVFGTGRNPSSAGMNGITLLPLEVTSDESVAACVTEVKRQTEGQLDVLINNVGTGILGAAEESSADQVRQLFDINFFGAVRMINAVLPMMRARQEGRIILLSSAGGIASVPFSGYYCATKHALEAYGEALRLELEPFQIRVATVAPGTVRTQAGDKAMQPDQPIAAYERVRQKTADRYVRAIHQGMSPERVAEIILRIIRSRRPRPRYTVGAQSAAVSAMKSWLPAQVFEAGIKQTIGD